MFLFRPLMAKYQIARTTSQYSPLMCFILYLTYFLQFASVVWTSKMP